MSNTENFIGVLISTPGTFDTQMIAHARALIRRAAEKLRANGGLNKVALGRALGIHRLRVDRITKALEITDIFDTPKT